MKSKSTIQTRFLFLMAFSLLTFSATAQAQFKKPLTASKDRATMNDAKLNVGILGGVNFTTWLHFNGPSSGGAWANYQQTVLEFQGKGLDSIVGSLGYFGGISLEYIINKNFSIGLNAVYARHNLYLRNVDDHFAIAFDANANTVLYTTKESIFRAGYNAIEAYVPFTYYITSESMRNVKPYVYLAPRASYVLNGTMSKITNVKSKTIQGGSTIPGYNQTDTVPFDKNNYTRFNLGGTLGLGSLFRINTSNYYFIIKFDISANFNALSTYSRADVLLYQHKLRYSADANATLTIQLPVKKQLKGACVTWGKYD